MVSPFVASATPYFWSVAQPQPRRAGAAGFRCRTRRVRHGVTLVAERLLLRGMSGSGSPVLPEALTDLGSGHGQRNTGPGPVLRALRRGTMSGSGGDSLV